MTPMIRRCARWGTLAVLGWGLACTRAVGVPASTPARPSLVVLVVVDGLRYADVERWREHFGPGGFRRLLEDGAVFDNARYPYATTQTCVGHATVATGTLPERHGIVANTWYDREAGAKVSCVLDAESPALDGSGGAGISPKRLGLPTLGDALLAARPSSRVLAVALKDRAAVMLAGHRGSAYWWGKDGFTTSRHYAQALPRFVATWNAGRPQLNGTSWELSADPSLYAQLGPDDDAHELPPPGFGRVFPHPIPPGDGFLYTPSGVDQLLDFSLSAVRAEHLGTRPGAVDLLAVGLSTVDAVNHAYGPDSHEALDTLLRVDRALAGFLSALDREVGRERVLVALTADHGMGSAPQPGGRLDGARVTQTLEAALDAAYGAETWLQAFTTPYLYLRPEAFAARGVRREDALAVGAKAIAALPGVAQVLTDTEAQSQDGQGLTAAVRASYFAPRAGDLTVLPVSGVLLAPDADCAGWHGAPYDYDQHVPLMVAGPGLKPARHARPVSPADVAPTLAAWLQVPLPEASGTPLPEATPPAR
ncbi:alkaline phosphatase family protein [Corallococcus sicarius]|uniref:Alkaline phosphatase family protein n=2 Tax=Corallococcus sicarius TaxID=2316726 RepID=A0A3A8P4G7_9BACT|nr:alkaline phosphatase family protein [Corallococcus sicarius]